MNIEGHMSIKIALWLHKSSKEARSNYHKFTTQHLMSIILTMMNLYNQLITAFIFQNVYNMLIVNLMNYFNQINNQLCVLQVSINTNTVHNTCQRYSLEIVLFILKILMLY